MINRYPVSGLLILHVDCSTLSYLPGSTLNKTLMRMRMRSRMRTNIKMMRHVMVLALSRTAKTFVVLNTY